MKRFYLILSLFLCPWMVSSAFAAGETPAAESAATLNSAQKADPPKIVVGQNVVSLGDAAGSTAKMLMYILAALLAGFGALKHFQQKKGLSPSAMRIVGKTSVGPRAALVLAEVEGRRFLLSQTPDRLTLISELSSHSQNDFHELLDEELDTQLIDNTAKASNER